MTATAPSTILELDPAEIHVDDHNHRIERKDDQALIDSLAESIKRNGQQQPCKVDLYPVKSAGAPRWRLVFGFRRYAACVLAGVKVRVDPIERTLSDAELLSLRATENLDRDNLNPVEECFAVAKLAEAIEATAGDVTKSAESVHQAIADRLGRTPEWVRDRLYVHRLPRPVKEHVAAGVLPLSYARELAKVADPGRCEDIVNSCLSYSSGTEPRRLDRSLSWLKNQVERERYSLRVVPWDVKVGFAGKPACIDCAHNTANDAALFEHDAKKTLPEVVKVKAADGDEVEVGLCTNKACHEKKQRAAQDAVKSGIGKARTAMKKDAELTASPVALAEAKLVPKGVKPSTFARAVANAAESGGAEKGSKAIKPYEIREKPQDQLDRALRERAQKLLNEAAKKINANAFAAVYVMVIDQIADGRRRLTVEEYKNALAADRGAVDRIVGELLKTPPEFYAEPAGYGNAKDWKRAEEIANAIGLSIPPAPTLADFQPKTAAKKTKSGAKA